MGELPPKITQSELNLVVCMMLMVLLFGIAVIAILVAFGLWLYALFGWVPATCYALFIIVVAVLLRLAGGKVAED